jgi:hypothetical protein
MITARGTQGLDTLDAAQISRWSHRPRRRSGPADPLDDAGRRVSIAQDPLVVGAPGSIPRAMSEPGEATTVRM